MSDPRYDVRRGSDGKLRANRVDGEEVCDFCLGSDPTWEYPAADMEVFSSVIDRSDDEWGACEECYRLIEASNIDGLVERMIVEHPRNYPPSAIVSYPPDEIARRICRRNVLRFMDARTGPAVRYQPQP